MILVQKKPQKSRKLKTYTPITIAVPKHLQDQIKKVPRQSLQAFLENRQTPTDWYNLTFRIKIGYDLAKEVYTQEAVDGMKQVLDACIAIKERYLQTKVMSMTLLESDLIEMGLDATDQMQDETTRRIQLEAFHESDRFMKRILKEVNGS